MKKLFICLTLIIICLPSFAAKINAQEVEEEGFDKSYVYEVTFTKDGKIETDFDGAAEGEFTFDNIQPGDNVKVTFHLNNEYGKPIAWYMWNASDAFEKTFGKNAGYEYELTYSKPITDSISGESTNIIFSSDVVGGDEKAGGKEGLEEATEDLDEYFLLQEGFAKGEVQSVVLVMRVDGETSWNIYQNAASDIKFQFAVELPPEKEVPVERVEYIPYTGDSVNLTFYVISEILALILFLAVLAAYYVYRRKQREA